MPLLVVEPALKRRNSHYYSYNAYLSKELKKHKITFHVLGSSRAERAISLGIDGFEPLFAHNYWEHVAARRGKVRRIFRQLCVAMTQTAQLYTFCRRKKGWDLFVPTASLTNSIAAILVAYFKRASAVKLLVRTDFGIQSGKLTVGGRLLVMTWRYGKRVLGSRLSFFTDSQQLARLLDERLNVVAQVVGTPNAFDYDDLYKKAISRPVVVFLGPPRHEKGSDLAVHAIAALKSREMSLDVEVRMQAGECDFGRELMRKPGAEHIEWLPSRMETEEYRAQIRECTAVCVPYRKASYANRISGVVVEAICAGRPVIFMEDTWMSTAVKSFGAGIPILSEDARAVEAALESYACGAQDLGREAMERAPDARVAIGGAGLVDAIAPQD